MGRYNLRKTPWRRKHYSLIDFTNKDIIQLISKKMDAHTLGFFRLSCKKVAKAIPKERVFKARKECKRDPFDIWHCCYCGDSYGGDISPLERALNRISEPAFPYFGPLQSINVEDLETFRTRFYDLIGDERRCMKFDFFDGKKRAPIRKESHIPHVCIECFDDIHS